MRYFLYCRKSSDREDRQILGPEAQKRILLEHAARQGLTVVEVYVEHQTAYKVGRPLFNAMLDRLEKGEADGILTYHLTRLARNSFDGGRLIYLMDEGTVRWIATPEKVYTNTGDDKFLMQIHFAMAKKSSDDTSQFVRRDVESKLLRGEYPGMVPLGYLNINRDGHITKGQDSPEKESLLRRLGRPLLREEVDPVDGPLVRRLCEEAARGIYTLGRLRKLSFELGLRARKTGKMLSKHAVENLLTNPYLYGVIEYNGRIYDAASLREKTSDPNAAIRHEPLIDKALFLQIQDGLRRRGKGRYRKHFFAFGGGMLRCDECGALVTAERQKGHVYYHCVGNRGPCAQRRWTREEALDAELSRLLLRLRLPQRFLDYALPRLRQAHADEAEVSAALRRKLQGQVNACQQRLDALLQLKIAPANADGALLSDDEYLRQKTALKAELETVQEQLSAAVQRGQDWVDDCEHFFRFTQRLAERFAEASAEDKRAMLQLVCSNLTLKDGKVAPIYRKPYASLADFPLAGNEEKFPSEPRKVHAEAEKPQIMAEWLRTLTDIRTFGFGKFTCAWPLFDGRRGAA